MTTYKKLDEALKLINQKYISLNTNEVKHNNERLRSTLWDLIGIMKKQDQLFDKLFEKIYFGGSYYDDLKVGKPDEFDLDLLLVVPKACETHKIKDCGCVKVGPSNKPGWFWFLMQKGYCTAMDKFIKDGYIQTNLVLDWLKSNLIIALNKLKVMNPDLYNYELDPPSYYSESGPALTLSLYGSFGKMDVDLVPAFKFGPQRWPAQGFRSNETAKTDFFIVPKKNKSLNYGERYWRPSFQDQERELIKGKERLKPALRLLKKMRNNLSHAKISSYALKTIVLSEIDTNSYNWSTESLGEVFMKFLDQYVKCLNNKRIPYYWNKNNNLLDGIHSETLINHHNEISRLLRAINENYLTDPCIVARVILKTGTSEYNEFLADYRQQSGGATNNNALSIRTSAQGIRYNTFDPSSLQYPSRELPSPRSTTLDRSSTMSSRSTGQETAEGPNWGTLAGIGLGIGAIAAVGLGILGALNRNTNQNN